MQLHTPKQFPKNCSGMLFQIGSKIPQGPGEFTWNIPYIHIVDTFHRSAASTLVGKVPYWLWTYVFIGPNLPCNILRGTSASWEFPPCFHIDEQHSTGLYKLFFGRSAVPYTGSDMPTATKESPSWTALSHLAPYRKQFFFPFKAGWT